MPGESDLPDDLREFAVRNAAEVASGRDLKTEYGFVEAKKWFQFCFVRNSSRAVISFFLFDQNVIAVTDSLSVPP